ncbi:MAG: hypothetical protein ACYSUQ_05630, partial [Planctomycetota bacterium]
SPESAASQGEMIHLHGGHQELITLAHRTQGINPSFTPPAGHDRARAVVPNGAGRIRSAFTGKSDPTARGITGPKNAKGETAWGGLADKVGYWGNWMLEKVKSEIGDLYPLIPDPAYKGKPRSAGSSVLRPPK